MLERFMSKHTVWLASKISITIDETCKTPHQMGRPTLSYTNAGTRLKRKLASELANENNCDTNLLAHAAAVSAKKQSKKDTAFVLKKTITTPEYSTESRKQYDIQKPIPLTPETEKICSGKVLERNGSSDKHAKAEWKRQYQ